MNKKLLTAWLIILMVLLIIVLGFMIFEGISFYSGGSFTMAFITTLGWCVLLFFMFFLPQQLKGGAGDFGKKIWIERWLVFPLAPMTLAIAMLPIAHFMNIQRQEGEIVKQFTCAIDTAKTMFGEYETYANERMKDYSHQLRHQMKLDRQNKMRCLQLQLLSSNYDTLHVSALKWVEASIEKPSTIDVFLMGNIDEIENAIDDWNIQLEQFSKHKLSDEHDGTQAFEVRSKSATISRQMLENLRQRYRQTSLAQLVTPWSIFAFVTLWGLLMLPYMFQKRHSKSDQSLGGTRHIPESEFMFYWEK